MCDTIQTRFHHFPQLITTSILSLFPLPYIISPPYNSPSQYAQNSFIPNLCRTCLPIPFPSPNPSTFSFFFFLIIRPPPTSPLFPSPPLFRSLFVADDLVGIVIGAELSRLKGIFRGVGFRRVQHISQVPATAGVIAEGLHGVIQREIKCR